MKKYDVAAYIWPAYTGDEPRTLPFWPEGNGEWETVREAKARFDGHLWPRKPLWGYVNEADPNVMEMEIEQAVSHGINVFIYDWYWFDNRPFLENCLNDGFLKAKNHNKMKFYLMWANHNVTYGWDRRISEKDTKTYIWQGIVTEEEYRKIGKRWIEKYFTLDEYYKIDGKPVLSIYDFQNFINNFGSIENTKKNMEWLDEECKKAGLKGIHFQIIDFKNVNSKVTGFDTPSSLSVKEVLEKLPISSITHYQYCHFAEMTKDFSLIMKEVEAEWEKILSRSKTTFYPHLSLGWDNTPRYPHNIEWVVKNNTPEEIEKGLIKVKNLADKLGVNLITINSWNEWTETSYLEPDDLYGYGYLDAVKKVFLDQK